MSATIIISVTPTGRKSSVHKLKAFALIYQIYFGNLARVLHTGTNGQEDFA